MMAKGSLRTLVTQSDAIRYLQQKKNKITMKECIRFFNLLLCRSHNLFVHVTINSKKKLLT